MFMNDGVGRLWKWSWLFSDVIPPFYLKQLREVMRNIWTRINPGPPEYVLEYWSFSHNTFSYLTAVYQLLPFSIN